MLIDKLKERKNGPQPRERSMQIRGDRLTTTRIELYQHLALNQREFKGR